MVNGEVKARDINKYLSGTKACQGTIDTKSRGLRNDIASFLILDGIRNRLTKQFHIYSADGNPDYPGKIIEFYIVGIDNNRIISDILSNKIGFNSSYVYSATLENNRIKLITQ